MEINKKTTILGVVIFLLVVGFSIFTFSSSSNRDAKITPRKKTTEVFSVQLKDSSEKLVKTAQVAWGNTWSSLERFGKNGVNLWEKEKSKLCSAYVLTLLFTSWLPLPLKAVGSFLSGKFATIENGDEKALLNRHKAVFYGVSTALATSFIYGLVRRNRFSFLKRGVKKIKENIKGLFYRSSKKGIDK